MPLLSSSRALNVPATQSVYVRVSAREANPVTSCCILLSASQRSTELASIRRDKRAGMKTPQGAAAVSFQGATGFFVQPGDIVCQ